MLEQQIRTAILHLRGKGHSLHKIAKVVGASRKAVRKVLRQGTSEVPQQYREEKLGPRLDQVRELHVICKGNMVRVQEELSADGVHVSYSTLTGFCRRHKIGVKEKQAAGRYHFKVGEEMQHDTSPHDVIVGDKMRRVQCASVVLCFSRMLYAQVYPTFNRFYCKTFLTEACRIFDGAAKQCMVDNTSVVIAHGTGKNAVPAPEMAAFGERFGFSFVAHEVGDANRSARVERPFHYIENNFYVGRTFADLADLNAQLRQWCDKVNHRYKKHIRSVPIELYQMERPHLKQLPIYIPEVYRIHLRVVDVEGYVTLHTNRYSVPLELIGREVEVRETQFQVTIQMGPRVVCEHERKEDGLRCRELLKEHQQSGRRRNAVRQEPIAEEQVLRKACSELNAMVDGLKSRHRGRAVRPLRRLHRMYLEYPTGALRRACRDAVTYGLWDLERVEQMVLKQIAGDFFRLSNDDTEEDND